MLQVAGIKDELGALFFEMSLEPSSRSIFLNSSSEPKSSMLLLPASAQSLSKHQPSSFISPELKLEILKNTKVFNTEELASFPSTANSFLEDIQKAIDNLTAKMKDLDTDSKSQEHSHDFSQLLQSTFQESNNVSLLGKPDFFDAVKDANGVR